MTLTIGTTDIIVIIVILETCICSTNHLILLFLQVKNCEIFIKSSKVMEPIIEGFKSRVYHHPRGSSKRSVLLRLRRRGLSSAVPGLLTFKPGVLRREARDTPPKDNPRHEGENRLPLKRNADLLPLRKCSIIDLHQKPLQMQHHRPSP